MPRGKKKQMRAPNTPVVAVAKQLAGLRVDEMYMAVEIAKELMEARLSIPKYIDIESKAEPPSSPAIVDVGGAISDGKSHAAPAKRAIKRASKKRTANEPAAPVREKSQLTLQFGKGKKSAAPAGE